MDECAKVLIDGEGQEIMELLEQIAEMHSEWEHTPFVEINPGGILVTTRDTTVHCLLLTEVVDHLKKIANQE